jgi:hypothetical protein
MNATALISVWAMIIGLVRRQRTNSVPKMTPMLTRLSGRTALATRIHPRTHSSGEVLHVGRNRLTFRPFCHDSEVTFAPYVTRAVGRSGESPLRRSVRRFFPHFAPPLLTCCFAIRKATIAPE